MSDQVDSTSAPSVRRKTLKPNRPTKSKPEPNQSKTNELNIMLSQNTAQFELLTLHGMMNNARRWGNVVFHLSQLDKDAENYTAFDAALFHLLKSLNIPGHQNFFDDTIEDIENTFASQVAYEKLCSLK
jgi:hypothetical protein